MIRSGLPLCSCGLPGMCSLKWPTQTKLHTGMRFVFNSGDFESLSVHLNNVLMYLIFNDKKNLRVCIFRGYHRHKSDKNGFPIHLLECPCFKYILFVYNCMFITVKAV